MAARKKKLVVEPPELFTCKRDELYELFGEFGLPPWKDNDGTILGSEIDCAPLANEIDRRLKAIDMTAVINDRLAEADRIIAERDASPVVHTEVTA